MLRRVSGKRNSRNMAICGDNLDVIKALAKSVGGHEGALHADIIYIDPPYNVGGHQDYRNRWRGPSKRNHYWAGSHGAFIDFIEPRIQLAHDVLGPSGIMMVSICDEEYSRLNILMDCIFREKNYLGTFVWDKGRGTSTGTFKTTHEYIMVYAKSKPNVPRLAAPRAEALSIIKKSNELAAKGMPHKEAQNLFTSWIRDQSKRKVLSPSIAHYCFLHPLTLRVFGAISTCAHALRSYTSLSPLTHPVTTKPCKVPKNGWKWCPKTLNKMLHQSPLIVGDRFIFRGAFVFGHDERCVPRVISYLDEHINWLSHSVIKLSNVPKTPLPPGVKFSSPKPVSLIKHLVRLYPNKQAVVLDYFAGSGTTAQAVHELNQEDGGTRSWVLVEQMQSTFDDVLLKRLEHFDPAKDWTTYRCDGLTARPDKGAKGEPRRTKRATCNAQIPLF